MNWCIQAVPVASRNTTGTWFRVVVRNWREWNLEQFQKSPFSWRVSIVGGTVFARLIGQARVPPLLRPLPKTLSAFLSRYSEWLSESDIEDFQGYTLVLHDSVALALFRANVIEALRLTGLRRDGEGGSRMGWLRPRDEVRPTTRCCRSAVRVIELHGRGVPISGVGLSAAFNCVSISSLYSTRADKTFRFGYPRDGLVYHPDGTMEFHSDISL